VSRDRARPLDRLETKNGVRHSSLWLFKSPAKKQGHLSLSNEPDERREAIWLYSKTTRTCENRALQSLYELPVEKEARRESLTALRRGHTHDLGGFLSWPAFSWYEHIVRIALSLIGQYRLCYILRMVYLRFF
jgi:hypothetical protein